MHSSCTLQVAFTLVGLMAVVIIIPVSGPATAPDRQRLWSNVRPSPKTTPAASRAALPKDAVHQTKDTLWDASIPILRRAVPAMSTVALFAMERILPRKAAWAGRGRSAAVEIDQFAARTGIHIQRVLQQTARCRVMEAVSMAHQCV